MQTQYLLQMDLQGLHRFLLKLHDAMRLSLSQRMCSTRMHSASCHFTEVVGYSRSPTPYRKCSWTLSLLH